MIKHIILWQLKDEIEDKQSVKENIKKNLEGLQGRIEGLQSIKVSYDFLDSSNAEIMLDSTFESEEALKGYSGHPEHVHVADTYVRPNVKVRLCADYKI